MAISEKMMKRIAENKKRVNQISTNFPHALKKNQIQQQKDNQQLAVAK